MRISELAAALGTRADNLKEDTKITGITTLEAARTGQVSFISSEKYAARAKGTGASAVIVPEGMQLEGTATLPMKEPWAGVLFLLNRFHPCDRHVYFRGTHASAVIDPAAKLGADVTVGPGAVIAPGVQVGARTVIGPNCVIGSDTTIGEDCIIHASVTVTHGIVIGNRVIVHPGSVIGADGFKYEVLGGRWTKIPQVGRVVIEDDAEIGANVCIDRASFTETRVGRNSKIDNLVQIAHNVDIGSDCVVVSQVGIAGSTTVGDGSILAAQCGIADNLRLGSRVRVLARAGVKDHLKDGETVVGAPARPFRTAAKIMAAEAKLPEMVAELHALKKRIEELEKKLAQG